MKVLMACEAWCPELSEDDAKARSVMREFRGELGRLPVLFDADATDGFRGPMLNGNPCRPGAPAALPLPEEVPLPEEDRTGEYEATRQAEKRAERRQTSVEPIDRKAFMISYQLKLAPLPCWAEIPRAAIGKRVKKMVAKIEAAAAKRRKAKGCGRRAWIKSETRIRSLG